MAALDLLPGEEDDAHSAGLDDVEHWIRVYSELVRTLRNMVESGRESPEIERRLQGYENRLRLWQQKLAGTRDAPGRTT